MALVNDRSIFNTCQPYRIIDSNIPWCAYHDNTLIMECKFDGHVFIRPMTSNNVYYLGCATGLSSPILLKHLYHVEKKEPMYISTSEVVSMVARRLQHTDEPDVQPLEHEKIARSAIWGVANVFGLQQKWLAMEQARATSLFDTYSLSNMKLIYPMVIGKASAANDVLDAYNGGKIIPLKVPHLEVFQWIADILT